MTTYHELEQNQLLLWVWSAGRASAKLIASRSVMDTRSSTLHQPTFMEDHSKTLLLLNSVSHHLDAVLRSIHGAPTIEIDLDTVNVSEGPNARAQHVVNMRPDQPGLHQGQVVVFKQDGGFTILLGKDVVAAARAKGSTKINGKLLSTMALKKCRVPVSTEPQIRPEPYYRDPQGVTNRPRLYGRESVRSDASQGYETREYHPSSDSYDRHQRQLRVMARTTDRNR